MLLSSLVAIIIFFDGLNNTAKIYLTPSILDCSSVAKLFVIK